MQPAPSMTRAWGTLPQPIRFLIVGGVNTAFGYGAYAFLLFVGFHYAAASFVGTVAGVLFNFLTTGTLVFDGLSPARLARFVAVYAATWVLNVALLAALVHGGFDPYVAGLVAIVPMALVSYLSMRGFVFAGRPWR